MICRVCGAQVPEGMLFCTSCGSPVNMAGNDSPQRQERGQVSQQGNFQQAPVVPQPMYGGTAAPDPQAIPMASATPSVAKKKSGSFKIVMVGMVSLLVLAVLTVAIFGFSQGWFSGKEPEKNHDDPKSTVDSAPSNQPDDPSDQPNDPTNQPDDPTNPPDDPTPRPTQGQTTQPAEPENEGGYAGAVSGKVYQNAYFDFNFAPARSWTFKTDQELADENNIWSYDGSEHISDLLNEKIEDGGVMQVMLAKDSKGNNVNLIVQQTPKKVLSLDMDELCELMVPTLEQQLENLGMNATVGTEPVTFLGERSTGISIVSPGLYQKQLYLVRDECLCIITITALNLDTAEDILGFFQEYDD